MYKKMMLLWLLLMVFAGSLLANGGKTEELRFEDHICDSLKIEHPLFQKVFPGVEFFVVTSVISLPPVRRLLGNVNGNRYEMPMQFNRLFKEVEKKSKATFFERMKAFVLLKYWRDTFNLKEDDGIKKESAKIEVYDLKPVSEKDKKKYQQYSLEVYEMKVKYNDNEYLWIIWMKDNQIKKIKMYYKGKKCNTISPFSALLKSRGVDIQITGGNFNFETHISEPDTTDHYYVIVSEDGSATNNSIVFEVTGLQPNQANVFLQVEPIDVYGDSLLLDQLLSVNSSGTAIYSWTPPNNNDTGFCEVQIDSSGTIIELEDTWLIPEHTKTGTFTSGYDYTIHFCNQFFAGHGTFAAHPLGIAHASTFAGYAEAAVTESWDKQVRNWILAQGCSSQGFNDVPIDDDGNYQICINDHDPTHLYHGTETNQASINDYRKIGIRYDSHLTENLYSTEENRIKVAMAHEFYHGIQMSHNLISSFGSHFSEMFWMIEGQARFLPSVQYKSEEFYVETTQHYYPKDANLYLSSVSPLYLNSSLHDLSYKYCLFWRLLFENYTIGSTADSLAIIRETCKGNINHNLPDIEAFMDSELTGTYDTMDDVIKDFAKNCYLNDQSYGLWNPCPIGFYILPSITNDSDGDGITDTFSGDTIIEPNSIPSSFGIDYMVFDFDIEDEEVNFDSLHFEGDPDDDGDMADFYVNVLFLEGTTFNSESEITLTNGEGSLGFIVDNPIDKVVVLIARLDADESTSDDDYFIKLTQGIDVSLVIDRSSSMGPDYGNEIVQVKNAANQFVALLNHGSNIAVSSFAQYATVDFPLTEIENDQTKLDAQNAINSIITGGYTSIGAGMQSGQGELNNNPTPNYPQAMILLSDGQENRSPYVVNILPTIPEGTDIYTIGLGSDADALLLSQIANYTDGLYFFSPDSTGLSDIFYAILQKVSDKQEIASFTGTVSGGSRQEILHDVIIDGSMQETTFSLLWQNSSNDLDLELIAPDNTIINPLYASTDPYVAFSSFPAIEFYTVTLPDSGRWKLKVIGVNIAETEDYIASVYGYSGLKLDIAFDNDNYVGQDTVNVTAILTDDEIPITGAIVEAEIEIPT